MRYLIFFIHSWAIVHFAENILPNFARICVSSCSKFSAQSWIRIFCSLSLYRTILYQYWYAPGTLKTVSVDGELDPLSPPMVVKEGLVDNDGVGEFYMLCITGHNNNPLNGSSYPKSRKGFIGKNGAWNPSQWPDRLSMLNLSMLSSSFCTLSVKV